MCKPTTYRADKTHSPAPVETFVEHHYRGLTDNERMMRVIAAPPAMKAKIDALLAGDETHVPKQDPDCRTCTLTEAARRMGISRPTVYRLIQRGAIRTVNLNGVSRVSLQSLFDYVANGEKVRGNYNAGDEA